MSRGIEILKAQDQRLIETRKSELREGSTFQPITLVPLGLGSWISPAVVVGIDPGSAVGWPKIAQISPFELLNIDQQAGGYYMSYPSAFGYVLRLADNRHKAKRDITDMLLSTEVVGESGGPGPSGFEPDPDFERLTETHGEAYTSDELDHLDNWLSYYFSMPRPVRGIEAFVELDASELHKYFLGWNYLECFPKQKISPPGGHRISDQSVQNYILQSQGPLTAEHLDRFSKQLRIHKVEQALRAFLIWENSD